MQPPITHYKDEGADASTESLVNEEMNKEAMATAAKQEQPDEKPETG